MLSSGLLEFYNVVIQTLYQGVIVANVLRRSQPKGSQGALCDPCDG